VHGNPGRRGGSLHGEGSFFQKGEQKGIFVAERKNVGFVHEKDLQKLV